MGNNCTHARTEVVETKVISKGLLTDRKVITLKCLDCLTDGKPTLITKEVHVGKLTGHVYKDKEVKRENCDHAQFTVDEATMKNSSEATLGGTIMGMMTAGWFEGRNTFTTATAQCEICHAKFKVRSNYTTENHWENYKVQTSEKHGEWSIMHKVTRKTEEKCKDEIMYVD